MCVRVRGGVLKKMVFIWGKRAPGKRERERERGVRGVRQGGKKIRKVRAFSLKIEHYFYDLFFSVGNWNLRRKIITRYNSNNNNIICIRDSQIKTRFVCDSIGFA